MEQGPNEPSAIDDRGDPSGTFTTDTAGLFEVSRPSVVRLKDGDRFEFRIGPVRKRLDGADLRMLAYNGSIPGPILHVDQGSEITVDVTNDGDVEATVHWHGLRLENRYDGVPHDTQAPIGIGETFTYKVQFPDAGFYWYHPHIREDFGLEMGLYGTIIVEPTDAAYWPEVDRQLSITLDDLLVEDGHIATFNKAGPNFTAMGRFGNVMLINGETSFAGDAAPGEVVRLYRRQHGEHADLQLRSSGSASQARRERQRSVRARDVHRRGAPRSLGAGRRRCALRRRRARSIWSIEPLSTRTTSVRSPWRAIGSQVPRRPSRPSALTRNSPPNIARSNPTSNDHRTRCSRSSRACRSCMAEALRRRTPARCIPMSRPWRPGTCPKCGMTLTPVFAPDSVSYLLRLPDASGGHVLRAGDVSRVRHEAGSRRGRRPTSYTCPMHPEVTSSEPGTCPECGMKLVPSDPASEPTPARRWSRGTPSMGTATVWSGRT